jgi:hypothetical protein
MPVLNGFGGCFVRVNGCELGQGNCHDTTVLADQHKHVSGADIFWRHAMDFNGFSFPER